MTLEFMITALIVVLIPGTGVVYTLAVGFGQGRLQSIYAAFGCTLGIVPHILASVLGLSAVLHTSAFLFQTVKYAGAAYLLYLAWQTLRDKGPLKFEADTQKRSSFAIAKTGLLINILNPKLSIFFLAFLPQFVPLSAQNATLSMLGLGAVFMAMTFAVFVLYGVFAAWVRVRLLGSDGFMTWLRRGSAGLFAALGARLALEPN